MASVSSLDKLQNDHIYKGEDNELILSQVYTTDFICDYDLRSYPFDYQKCRMNFIMQVSQFICICRAYNFQLNCQNLKNIFFEKGMSGKFVRLVQDQLHYLGPSDLTQYFVVSYKMNESTSSINDNKGVQVDIIFSRRLLNQVLTVFLPCMLLCIVAFTTSLYRV